MLNNAFMNLNHAKLKSQDSTIVSDDSNGADELLNLELNNKKEKSGNGTTSPLTLIGKSEEERKRIIKSELAKFQPEVVEKILNEYIDETDLDKLVFLAEGLSFDF